MTVMKRDSGRHDKEASISRMQDTSAWRKDGLSIEESWWC